MDPFVILHPLGILVCKDCHIGCVTEEIKTHLRDRHRGLPVKRRNAIYAYFQGVEGLIRDQNGLASFAFPSPDNAAIPLLPGPYRDGFACTECAYVVRQLHSIKAHCRKSHGWSGKTAVKGLDARLMWRSEVSCQQLFASRAASRLFEVERGQTACSPAQNLSVTSQPDELSQHALAYSQQQYKRLHTHASSAIEAGDEKLEPNLWLQRTQWATHLQGRSHKRLIEAMTLRAGSEGEPTSETEQLVMLILESISRVIRASQRTAKASVVGHAVLIEIYGYTHPSEKRVTFKSRMEKQTLILYTQTLQHIVAYIIRTIEDWDSDDRPPYTLTTQQEEAYDQLTFHLSDISGLPVKQLDKKTDELTLAFLIALLDHQLKDDSYESALLSGLAVLGIQSSSYRDKQPAEELNWLRPSEYTQYYAAVIKVARMLVIRQAYLENKRQIQELQANSTLSRREAEASAPGIFSLVREQVRRFMTKLIPETVPTPMSWILESLAYGAAIRKTTIIQGKVQWIEDEITFERTTFTMAQLREMVRMSIEEISCTMASLLFLSQGEQPPAIDWDKIKDDMSNCQTGYSFLEDDRNTCFAGRTDWLVRRIIANQSLSQEWILDKTQPFRIDTSKAYLRLVDTFRSKLLFLVHFTAGQPARRTEILSLRFQNTSYGNLRNIFIQQGLVCIVTWYHKNYLASESYKAIHRYLPREVGENLIRYLWLVLPLAQQLQSIGTREPRPSPFLWSTLTIQHIGLELQESASAESGSESGSDMEYEATSGSLALWRPDRMTYLIKQNSQRLIGISITVRVWRQMATAITRRYFTPDIRGVWHITGHDSDSSDDEGFKDYIEDLQSGHTSMTAGMMYGRQAEEGLGLPAIQQDRYRLASRRWHHFLGLGAETSVRRHKRSFNTFAEQLGLSRARRLSRLRQVDLQGQLCQMLRSDTAVFKGIQLPVLQGIIGGKTPVLQVMATGAGKSLSFMLPAYCSPKGVNIVIVPMLALQGDLASRLRASQIHVDIWESTRPTEAASVVLVTPESATTTGFRDFINGLIAREQLDRVFVDECHLVLDGSYEFRPAFLKLGDLLGDIGVQIVCMTATLPPHELSSFCLRLGFQQDRLQVYRSSTARPNLQYIVREVTSEPDRLKEVQLVVKQLQELYKDGKIIIYCQYVDQVEKVASLLQCPAYYHKVGTVENKNRIVQTFQSSGALIACTNALGVGLDIPNVRGVIHLGSPKLFRDYVQETGRAGRDGKESKVILITAGSGKETGSTVKDLVEGEPVHTSRFIQWRECRRVFLDRVMDGIERVGGCQEDGATCDFCSQEAEEEPGTREILADLERIQGQEHRAREAVQLRRKKAAESFSRLEKVLLQWRSWCIVCVGKGRQVGAQETRHSKKSCPFESIWRSVGRSAQETRAGVFQQQRLTAFSGCFRCGLPQRICESWEVGESGGREFRANTGRRCQYSGIMEEVIGYMQTQKPETVQKVIARLQTEGFRYQGEGLSNDFYVKIGRRRDWGEEQSNWLCYFFYLLSKKLSTGKD